MKFNFLKLKKNTELETLKNNVTKESINRAFKNRSVEIDSLKKYDRGEKKITPRDLKSIVSGI
ncbi:MAG: hypothetical protein QG563_512 [Patescibacteria group bacterium]|jgi:hypothetical protein|nr:hypothetical protein [Patescibacteria group bacterium]